VSGVYIHVPFCAKRCTYCDFHFSTTFGSYREKMLRSLQTEILQRKQELNSPLKSIYFGGGTPSILTEGELSELLNSVYRSFSLDKQTEITLEVNPENVSEKNAKSWKKIGVNRLSIGLQSFKNEDLEWMNRGHNSLNNIESVQIAKNAGFDNISIDLIYGLPGLKNEEWLSFLEKLPSLGVNHVSAYCLTVENKTKLKSDIIKGLIKPLPEDKQIEQFKLLCAFLKKHRYEHYEVSSFALSGSYSKHNRSYWERKKYIGIGPSAHSFNGNTRRWNVSNNHVYMSRGKGDQKWYKEETLSKNETWNEVFLTGLRTKWGVSKKNVLLLGGFLIKEKEILNDLIQKNYLFETETAFILSRQGLLFADAISERFFRVS